METIRLERGVWQYDPSQLLGPPGGFGAVFAGTTEDHSPVAVKKLKMDANEAAHREMKIAEELIDGRYSNIIPVFDCGLDADSDSYFVVMAKADYSLQEHIVKNGPLTEEEAVKTILSIASGLVEGSAFIHRDLKPGNILWHDNDWKIADYGIAKFYEYSTSLRTLKNYLTPQYAAPEQWNYETATHATDIYALGCISHTLLTGNPPFLGGNDEIKKDHLQKDPPVVGLHVSSKLQACISMMLRKHPGTRIKLDRLIKLLNSILENNKQDSGPNLVNLEKTGQQIAEQLASQEAQSLALEAEKRDRTQLAEGAHAILRKIVTELFEYIETAAPTARMDTYHSIQLGQARLAFGLMDHIVVLPKDKFTNSHWNVITSARISVKQENPFYNPGFNLWYMDQTGDDNYRWYEVGYMMMRSASPGTEPFYINQLADADYAAARIAHTCQIAWGPICIDDEDAKHFISRWIDIFDRAASGTLQPPTRLPLNKPL